MDEEEGFCIEKTEITTNYREMYQERLKEQEKNLISMSEIPMLRNSLSVRSLSDPTYQKYHMLLQDSQLINQQLRQQQGQRYLMYTPLNRVVYNNATRRVGAPTGRSTLVFDSQFECGNLDIAVKKKMRQYDLYLRPDTNTQGNFQWFYFKVFNTVRNETVRFNIRNLSRNNTLYSQGLCPYFFSDLSQQSQWKQLQQVANSVMCYQNQEEFDYTLTFTYEFQHDFDIVSFACQPPYTYSKMLHQTKNIHQQLLCQSLLGFKLSCLIVKPKDIQSVGLAIGRQHPGETVGSWMIHGFIKEIVERQPNVLWYIVPMVNPDGVFVGNNRTGVAGFDYNRLYSQDEQLPVDRDKMTPEITAIMNLIRKIKKKYSRLFRIFIDFHGHSSRHNIFTYGPPYTADSPQFLEARLFPALIGQRTPLFKPTDCSYNIPKVKKNTARSFCFNKIHIPFCYTVESSFGLANCQQLTENGLINTGRMIASASTAFLDYINTRDEQSESCAIIRRIRQNGINQTEKQQCDDSSEDEMEATKTMSPKSKIKGLVARPKDGLIRHSFIQKITKIKTEQGSTVADWKRDAATPRLRLEATDSMGMLQPIRPRNSSVRASNKFGRLIIRQPKTPTNQDSPNKSRRNLTLRNFGQPDPDVFKSTFTNTTPIFQKKCFSRKKEVKNPSLLDQLARNLKNKVGRQMLIINQF